MNYKVNFSGFAYIEADSEEEAKDKYHDDNCVYVEANIDDVEEVDDFIVEM